MYCKKCKKNQSTILEAWNDGSGNDCGNKFTLVLFKIEEKLNNNKHCNVCVSHDFFYEDDDVEKNVLSHQVTHY